VKLNKKSSEKGEKRLFTLPVLAALFVHFKVFGFRKTDEILDRCGYSSAIGDAYPSWVRTSSLFKAETLHKNK
jgi:hypothetical protein